MSCFVRFAVRGWTGVTASAERAGGRYVRGFGTQTGRRIAAWEWTKLLLTNRGGPMTHTETERDVESRLENLVTEMVPDTFRFNHEDDSVTISTTDWNEMWENIDHRLHAIRERAEHAERCEEYLANLVGDYRHRLEALTEGVRETRGKLWAALRSHADQARTFVSVAAAILDDALDESREGELSTVWHCRSCGWKGDCQDLDRTDDNIDPSCPNCGHSGRQLQPPEDWSEQCRKSAGVHADEPEGGERDVAAEAGLRPLPEMRPVGELGGDENPPWKPTAENVRRWAEIRKKNGDYDAYTRLVVIARELEDRPLPTDEPVSENGFYHRSCVCGHERQYHHYDDGTCQRCECSGFHRDQGTGERAFTLADQLMTVADQARLSRQQKYVIEKAACRLKAGGV